MPLCSPSSSTAGPIVISTRFPGMAPGAGMDARAFDLLPSSTPGVPVPYANVAQSAAAAGMFPGAGGGPSVRLLNVPPVLQSSAVPASAGDEPSSAGVVGNHLQTRGLSRQGAVFLSAGRLPTAASDLMRLRLPGVSTARLLVGR